MPRTNRFESVLRFGRGRQRFFPCPIGCGHAQSYFGCGHGDIADGDLRSAVRVIGPYANGRCWSALSVQIDRCVGEIGEDDAILTLRWLEVGDCQAGLGGGKRFDERRAASGQCHAGGGFFSQLGGQSALLEYELLGFTAGAGQYEQQACTGCCRQVHVAVSSGSAVG